MSDNVMVYDLKDHILRITAALYRVTDLFHDEEPLKWSLRKNAMEIVDLLAGDGLDVPSRYHFKEMERGARLIRSIQKKLALAEAGGFVSKLNFDVIAREYNLVLGQLERESVDKNMNVFDEVSLTLIPALESGKKASENGQGNAEVLGAKKAVKQIETLAESEKASALLAVDGAAREAEKKSPKTNGHMSINERQEKIVRELSLGQWLSAGSFIPIFKGQYSEKTIQRDLNSLVTKGVLRAEGEKRWRRYALVATAAKVGHEKPVSANMSNISERDQLPAGAAGSVESAAGKEILLEEKANFADGASWI